MIPDLVTVGGLTVDNVIAADGRVALARAGGNGAYSAVGILMWRSCVGLVSTTVASYPRDAILRLEAGGVDMGGVRWRPDTITSCGWFIYDNAGRRDEGLNSPPEALAEAGFPTDILTPAQIASWRVILRDAPPTGEVSYSGFRNQNPITAAQVPNEWHGARGVLLAPSQPDVMRDMLDLFKPGGAIVIADPGWQLAEQSLEDIAPLLSRLDAFLPSEVELRALVPGAPLSDALQILADICPGALAVKLGAEGVLVWDRTAQSTIAVPAIEAAPVDPTGAGDSFCGGFLVGLVETGNPVEAARFGAMSAAQIVEHFGADGALPGRPEILRSYLNHEKAHVSSGL